MRFKRQPKDPGQNEKLRAERDGFDTVNKAMGMDNAKVRSPIGEIAVSLSIVCHTTDQARATFAALKEIGEVAAGRGLGVDLSSRSY